MIGTYLQCVHLLKIYVPDQIVRGSTKNGFFNVNRLQTLSFRVHGGPHTVGDHSVLWFFRFHLFDCSYVVLNEIFILFFFALILQPSLI